MTLSTASLSQIINSKLTLLLFLDRINARQYQKTASAGMGMGAGGNMSGMPGQ